MLKRLAALFLPVAAALVFAPPVLSAGGHYVFVGGTAAERSQVVQALDASSFPWDIVPKTVAVHIAREPVSEATPGAIWLDASLLDTGRFSWGVVQHEYAHQVDFLVLTSDQRDRLAALLGGATWWNDGSLAHDGYGCERFATSIAWAYWPTLDNALRPSGPQDEGGQLSPASFRAALASILPDATPDRTVAAVKSSVPVKPAPRHTLAAEPKKSAAAAGRSSRP